MFAHKKKKKVMSLSSIYDQVYNYLSSQSKLQLVEHAVVSYVAIKTLHAIYKKGLIKSVATAVKNTSLGGKVIQSAIENEATKTVNEMFAGKCSENESMVELPSQGVDPEVILQELRDMKLGDVNPSEGKTFAYVYEKSEEHNDFITKAHNLFIHSNALSPMAFSSLRRMEVEIVEIVKKLLHGDKNAVGSLTSGGTESLELMLLAYRDRARSLHPEITEPEIILCETAHPAIYKAAHYFNINLVFVPFDKNMRMDIEATRRAINKNTILLVGSAPQYPHGVMDPIAELSELAQRNNLPLHVDSCIGGLVLPFVEKLGYTVEPFDFRLEGVTSISADLHKYGYAPKGSSVILYRDASYRKYQFYAATTWPGGFYISPTLQGTRGGGPIAAAWASLQVMGHDGFLQVTKSIMQASKKLQNAIDALNDIELIGSPVMTIVSFKSSTLNVYAIADRMEEKGWKMERQRRPETVHMTIMPQHVHIIDQLIADLKESIQYLRQNSNAMSDNNNKGTVAMYGMIAKVENANEEIVQDFLLSFMNAIYKPMMSQ